jgi:four helix bundle protein
VIKHFSDLDVYREAFRLGLHAFEISRTFPPDERYALTDQLRRSARSVGANIAEAWGKRRYEAHFISKLSDADKELHETEHWLAYAFKHNYIAREDFDRLRAEIALIGRQLGTMMARPRPFLLKPIPTSSDL